MRLVATLGLALVLVAQSTGSWAASGSQESTMTQIGAGVGSAVGTAVYFPFKAAFCILGGITSGFTLIAAGPQTATRVADTTCRGTWAITPDIVKGNEPVKFIGDSPPGRSSHERHPPGGNSKQVPEQF